MGKTLFVEKSFVSSYTSIFSRSFHPFCTAAFLNLATQVAPEPLVARHPSSRCLNTSPTRKSRSTELPRKRRRTTRQLLHQPLNPSRRRPMSVLSAPTVPARAVAPPQDLLHHRPNPSSTAPKTVKRLPCPIASTSLILSCPPLKSPPSMLARRRTRRRKSPRAKIRRSPVRTENRAVSHLSSGRKIRTDSMARPTSPKTPSALRKKSRRRRQTSTVSLTVST